MARSRFGPVVLLGLASGTGVAVAGNQDWASEADSSRQELSTLAINGVTASEPLATALALVVLACWGVVLVTRGKPRRGVSVVGALAALGALAAVAYGFFTTPDVVRDALIDVGTTPGAVSHTAWYWFALICAVASVGTTLVAVRLVPTWPEMGRRYDAPGSASPAAPVEDASNLDLWRAIDEGRDPTR